MQAINSNDNDNQDPIQELPNEMFTSIISLLPPSSIAQSSAISRLWRESIISNPTLHQEVDLTSRTARDLDLSVISGHFDRLAALSQNRLVKVSMNFSTFCSEWIETWDPEDPTFVDPTFLGHFLSRIKLSKQTTLQELRFSIEEPFSQEGDDTMDFICYLLGKLKDFGSLRSILIEAARVPISLKCGEKTPGSPQLVIQSTESDGAEINEIVEFIRRVKQLVGKGLTEFSCHYSMIYSYGLTPDHLATELFEELSKSKLELDRLDVFDLELSQNIWPFVFQFENLTDLQLLMFRPQAPGENEVLRVPQDVIKGVPMKHLRLQWHGLQVDWESVARWFGSSLETLKLGIDVDMSRDSGFLLSNSYGSMVYNSQETLKILHLFTPETVSLVFHVDLAETSDTKLFFPNLEELSLRNVNDSVFETLWNLNSPKLHKLDIQIAYPIREAGIVCLRWNLERHASKLTELTILLALHHTFPFTSKSHNFKCLRRLEVKVGPKTLYDWLSRCQFQNLESLSCEEERSKYPCLEDDCLCGEKGERDRSDDFKLLMPFHAPKLRFLDGERIRRN